MNRFLVLICVIFFFFQSAMAQHVCSAASCLGTTYGITVDFDEDRTDGGYLVYTIPVSSYGINQELAVTGPVTCFLQNYVGTMVDLYVNKRKLQLEFELLGVQAVNMDIVIRTNTTGIFSDVNGHGYEDYYHYHICLSISSM